MDLLHGRYRIDKPLGSGGAGTTWLAIDTQTGARVTVKKLNTPLQLATRDALERETTLLGQIDHPQIPAFVDVFTENWRMQDYLHLVLAYVEGEPLDQEMARRRYNQDEAQAVVEDLLSIVAWLHELAPPVIHRDIKPSNVIRRPDGKVALIDFGLATDAVQRTFMHTMAAGTLGYQAPEQIAGDPRPASDVYSVGALALELLTRTSPRELLSGQTLRWKNKAAHLDPRWVGWLERALAPDPDARFPSGRDALQGLRTGRHGPPPRPPEPRPSASSPSLGPRQPSSSGAENVPAPRFRAILSFGMIGVFLMGGAVALLPWMSSRDASVPREVATASRPPKGEPSPSSANHAAACRAGDDQACLDAAEALGAPSEFGSVPLRNRKLGEELLGLSCARSPGNAQACVSRAAMAEDPSEAVRWWARACVLEAEGACATLAGVAPRHSASFEQPILRRLARDCATRTSSPDRRDLQASCALQQRWHLRGLGGDPDPQAADRIARSVCPDQVDLGCLARDLQPLEL